MRLPRRAAALTLATTFALALSACGSGSTTTSPGSSGASSSSAGSSADSALAALVPDAVKSDGVITVGTDATYAPNEFLDADGKTVVGFDVDLFTAIAAKLGLKAQFVSAPFDNIIPSVQSGKYEVGVSSFTVNADREKQADMVSYFSAGTQWASAAGNPQKVTADDACGKKIAVQKATVQVDDITKRSGDCTKAGKPAIVVDQYQGQDQATAAVVSGKDDAMLADSPVIAYAVKQTNGKLALLGDIYDSAPYGYVLKKGLTGFGDAITKALTALKSDGSYTKILDKWGVTQGAIDSFAVNPTVS
jgi:polar amino acid transport system substrate-binding protein